MEAKGRHFVLVHGACHGAWCWYKLATLLQSAGNKVTALDLGASGINPKQVQDISSISDYFEPLMKFMKSLPADEKVILVGHSLGGISTSVAMERFPDKVSVAVFAAAYMPSPELSYVSIQNEIDSRTDYMDSVYYYDDGLDRPPTSFVFGPKFMQSTLYQLSPPEDWMLATLLVRPVPVFDDATSQKEAALTKERYGSVSRVCIICDQDLVLPEDLQKWMIEKDPPAEVKLVAGSDHMIMICKPQELCACLQEIAKKYP